MAYDSMIRVATEGYGHPELQIYAPFIRKTKADIARLGIGLGIDYSLTWSCYKGKEVHCGKCGTCYERREAFDLIGHADPTVYSSAWEPKHV
jgi:7-cyano-7-deazaguanine synthase